MRLYHHFAEPAPPVLYSDQPAYFFHCNKGAGLWTACVAAATSAVLTVGLLYISGAVLPALVYAAPPVVAPAIRVAVQQAPPRSLLRAAGEAGTGDGAALPELTGADKLDAADGVIDGMYYGMRVPKPQMEAIDLDSLRGARTAGTIDPDVMLYLPAALLGVGALFLGLQRLFAAMQGKANFLGVEVDPGKPKQGGSTRGSKRGSVYGQSVEDQFTDEVRRRGIDK